MSIAILDFIAVVATAISLYIVAFNRRSFLIRPSSRFIMPGLLISTLLYNISLFVEWGGIRHDLEQFENVIGALLPAWWAFAFYGLYQIVYTRELKEAYSKIATLLAEVHHRTRNNMNVILSILHFQMEERRGDEHSIDMLMSVSDRIYSMSLVHDLLYDKDEFNSIPLESYLQRLIMRLRGSLSLPESIKVNLECNPVRIDLDTAIPLGLALNEVINNSMKHAFTGESSGSILIQVRELHGKQIEIIISDNGVGLPEALDIGQPTTLGLRITKMLVEDQLKGGLNVKSVAGSKVTLLIPLQL